MPAKRTADSVWKGASLEQSEHDELTLVGHERQEDVARDVIVVLVGPQAEDGRSH